MCHEIVKADLGHRIQAARMRRVTYHVPCWSCRTIYLPRILRIYIYKMTATNDIEQTELYRDAISGLISCFVTQTMTLLQTELPRAHANATMDQHGKSLSSSPEGSSGSEYKGKQRMNHRKERHQHRSKRHHHDHQDAPGESGGSSSSRKRGITIPGKLHHSLLYIFPMIRPNRYQPQPKASSVLHPAPPSAESALPLKECC